MSKRNNDPRYELNIPLEIPNPEEKDKAFICYNHEANFIFRKKEFIELLGLNPEAFYDIIGLEDRNEGTVTLKLSVKDSKGFFLEDSSI